MSKKRILYFDLLNIAACISVVALHCNVMVHGWQPGLNWKFGLGIEVIFYWAVPVFFMLTGATCLEYRNKYDTKTFLSRRFSKTLIPFIAWNIILYLVISVGINRSPVGPRTFVNMVLSNQIEDVYWFFFPLFSIYLSIPILSKLVGDMKTIRYAIATVFVCNSVLPFILPLIGIQWNANVTVTACSGMLIYVLLGYYLSKTELTKKQRMLVYVAGILASAFRYLYTMLSSDNLGYVDRFLFNYSAFPAVLEGAAIFVLFKELNLDKLESKSKAIRTISACSFGVYLIHKPILDYFVMGSLGIANTSLVLRTIGVPIIWLGCVLIVLALKKIPVVKRIVP